MENDSVAYCHKYLAQCHKYLIQALSLCSPLEQASRRHARSRGGPRPRPCRQHHMLLLHIRSGDFTNLTLLLTGLGELQEMTIGIAEEGSDLIAPVHRLSEELAFTIDEAVRGAPKQVCPELPQFTGPDSCALPTPHTLPLPHPWPLPPPSTAPH